MPKVSIHNNKFMVEYHNQTVYVLGQFFRAMADKNPDLSGYVSDEDIEKLKNDGQVFINYLKELKDSSKVSVEIIAMEKNINESLNRTKKLVAYFATVKRASEEEVAKMFDGFWDNVDKILKE